MAKKNGFLAEFKTFAMRGNVIDLAVGTIIGAAFGKITNSLVNDVIMPTVSMLMGGINFSDWKLVLKEAELAADGSVAVAAVSVNYGALLSTIVDFIILAFAIFCMVKAINTMREKAEALKKKEEEEAKAAAEAAPPAPPAPSAEEVLLTEIRDLLKAQQK